MARLARSRQGVDRRILGYDVAAEPKSKQVVLVAGHTDYAHTDLEHTVLVPEPNRSELARVDARIDQHRWAAAVVAPARIDMPEARTLVPGASECIAPPARDIQVWVQDSDHSAARRRRCTAA